MGSEDADSGLAMKTQAEKPSPPPVPQAKLALNIPKILFEGDEPIALPAPEPVQKHLPPPPVAPIAQKPVESALPQSYGTGKLSVMARDPHWLYAHWDPAPHQPVSAKRTLMVRVFAHDKPSEPESESNVHPDSQHCFIHVARAGTSYVAELGYYKSERDWVKLAASKPVTMPPDAPSGEMTVQFATISPSPAPESQPQWKGAFGNRPNQRLETTKARETTSATTVPASAKPEELASKLNEDVVRVTPGLLERIIGRKQPPLSLAPGGGIETSPGPLTLVQGPAPEWTEAQERALQDELAGYQPAIGPVSSAALPEMLGISSIEAISSALEARPQLQGFWLNLNAELIVYGATEPDALLNVGGFPIQLRPDGSFTCRFALPDGAYELPVLACSKDGELLQATLKFSRVTEQHSALGIHPIDPALKPPGDKSAT